jgi:hypothetical protein
MKKIYMTMVAMLCGATAMAQIGSLTCADVALEAGNTAYIEVELVTDDATAISGIGFNLLLPEGVTVAQYYNEDDEEWVEDVTFPIAKAKHQTGYQGAADGSLLVWCAGDNSLSFRTTTTTVMKMGVTVSKEFANGEYELKFYNIALSDKSDPITPASFPVDDFTAKLTVSGGTGINGINALDSKAPVYNVVGQRVNKAQKGVFIQNGKKVAVK